MPSARVIERNEGCAVCDHARASVRALFVLAVKPAHWERDEPTRLWIEAAEVAVDVWKAHPHV